ncbi:AAA family ATPase [Catellatospora citrea]|uniref:AAA family ATPase n=1 Tax=Catellatospora citrea TaxID=53366 RepID=UPI0033CC659F
MTSYYKYGDISSCRHIMLSFGGPVRVLAAVVGEYKSIHIAEVPLGGLTILLGPNGSGKTNLIEAIGAHDPAARKILSRVDGRDATKHARLGLVVKFDVDSNGHGADAEQLRQMMIWPWQEGLSPRDITDGFGAYCGSTWWLYGGDLYDPRDQATLKACYDVVRRSLLDGIEQSLVGDARRLIDLLLAEPVVIVQEDFTVELACDRSSASGRQAVELARRLTPLLNGGALHHMIGVLNSWTSRWPPLTAFTRGPARRDSAVPAGFAWFTERLGGVHVVNGDASALEQNLDRLLERVHDRLYHQPAHDMPGAEDEFCDRCLHPDHAGRVDPTCYATDESDDGSPRYEGDSEWLEQADEWLRVRPELRAALAVIEREANLRLMPFVATQGEIRLNIRPVPEWASSLSRCYVNFEHQTSNTRAVADWGGPVGVAGHAYPRQDLAIVLPLADLGSGTRRWVAAAVRLAADACAEGEPGPSRRILLIDEPEQHLHPAAQHEVAVWCLEQARRQQAVVVATHSPAFTVLPPSLVTTCQVKKSHATTHVCPLPPVHGSDVVLRARELGFGLGLGRDALAQLTRAVAVVEGDWDRRLLHHFYGARLAQQRVLIVALQGSNELGGYADATVIPALGLPVVAMLDEVRGCSREELENLTPPLTKAERALLELATNVNERLRFVRYDDPDVICALPEPAVRRAFPNADFPGWDELLRRWQTDCADADAPVPFKKWVLRTLGLPKSKRLPSAFFSDVLAECGPEDMPHPRFQGAAEQLLAAVDQILK